MNSHLSSFRAGFFRPLLHLALSIGLAATGTAASATPWAPSPIIPPQPTPSAPAGPDVHPGKEFSDERDRDAAGVADPGQVILWDGVGGTADGVDLVMPPAGTPEPDHQTDAIANNADALFRAVVENRTPAAFSLRTMSPAAGPSDVGGVAVYYEAASGGVGAWASPPVVDGMFPVQNLDGLEVWGPEGPTPGHSDTNRYSRPGDALSGTSVFNVDGSGYLSHSILAAAVIGFDPVLMGLAAALGGEQELTRLIDLDALMVSDLGVPGEWSDGDRILFSLWPIMDPMDPLMAAYVGDAAYVLSYATDAAGAPAASATFFDHGGHLWTDSWTAAHFGEAYNVDALEALAPEPGILGLLAAGLIGFGAVGRRRGMRPSPNGLP